MHLHKVGLVIRRFLQNDIITVMLALKIIIYTVLPHCVMCRRKKNPSDCTSVPQTGNVNACGDHFNVLLPADKG